MGMSCKGHIFAHAAAAGFRPGTRSACSLIDCPSQQAPFELRLIFSPATKSAFERASVCNRRPGIFRSLNQSIHCEAVGTP